MAEDNKRIAKNTIFLYFRMILTMFVGLYASRVVLRTLGVSDFGLYNVVGGFVSMLSFLSSTMTNGTQRFLSYELGTHNYNKLRAVFSNALTLHFLMAGALLLIAETIGLWFLYNYMTIPEGRETAAFWVFQFSIFTFLVSVIQVPFMSSLISHEKMDIYAYMSIYDAVMKLLVVYLIGIGNFDKLVFYSFLICLVQVSSALLYNIYTQRHFEECRLRFCFNGPLIKEMSKFSGWTLIGAFGYTANGQGVNVLLNMFFGTVINAARGIAFQVTNILAGFSRNLQVASNPQIIKLYADGQIEEMSRLARRTSKFCAFLLLLIMTPVFVDVEYILQIWLGEYPEHTPLFMRIVLIQALIQSMSGPVVTVTHAGGKLKMPNLTAGVAVVLALPISFFALKWGCSPETVLIINIIPWIFECFFDSFYAQKYTGFSLIKFYKETYFVVLGISSISITSVYYVCHLLNTERMFGLIVDSFISVSICALFIWILGLNNNEKEYISNMVKSKLINKLNGRSKQG